MKKRSVLVATFVTLILATGCSQKGGTVSASTQAVSTSVAEKESSTADASEETMEEIAAATTGEKGDAQESSITGTISEIKDFMFVITDSKDNAYSFTFEGTKPEGLSSVKEGDTVKVVYTGELDEIEAFTGTVISVTKQ